MSSFGLIEKNMELSHIYLAVWCLLNKQLQIFILAKSQMLILRSKGTATKHSKFLKTALNQGLIDEYIYDNECCKEVQIKDQQILKK
jgi:hypothetical protein